MDAQLKRGLLDVCVLAAIKSEDSYGYKIIKDLRPYIELSESTLYTILKRLESAKMLTVRTAEHGEPILRVPVETCTSGKSFTGELPTGLGGKEALYFSVEGKGGTFDFVSFDLA